MDTELMTPKEAAEYQQLLADCKAYLNRGERIEAIRLYRSRTNANLSVAMAALDFK